jgi:hypothetical protein
LSPRFTEPVRQHELDVGHVTRGGSALARELCRVAVAAEGQRLDAVAVKSLEGLADRKEASPAGARLPPPSVDTARGTRISLKTVATGFMHPTRSRFEEAAAHYENALSTNRRLGARPWLAHTQEDYARMLLDRRETQDARRARSLLEDALATYVDLGMDSFAARVRQDGAVAPRAAASDSLTRLVGAYASVVGCRGWPGRATYGGRRPCTSLRR